MTESFRLRHRLIKLCLTLEWLMDQLRRRQYSISRQQLQDIYDGKLTGKLADEVIARCMAVLDDYEMWLSDMTLRILTGVRT